MVLVEPWLVLQGRSRPLAWFVYSWFPRKPLGTRARPLIQLMIKILHHPISIYIYIYICVLYCTTRFPMVSVYKVYIKSCRISIISSLTRSLPKASAR